MRGETGGVSVGDHTPSPTPGETLENHAGAEGGRRGAFEKAVMESTSIESDGAASGIESWGSSGSALRLRPFIEEIVS